MTQIKYCLRLRSGGAWLVFYAVASLLPACGEASPPSSGAAEAASGAASEATGGVSGEGSSGGAGGAEAPANTAAGAAGSGAFPPAGEPGGPCILNADCPRSTHCDLGECVMTCETDRDCSRGESCSTRGRCLDSGEVEAEPPPVTEHEGTVRVTPSYLELSERDTEFQLALDTTSEALVPYRVELRAPFLRLEQPERGALDGAARLLFAVDAQRLNGSLNSGSITIYTDLGNAVVNVALRVGLTGKYQGVLRYHARDISLGDVGVAFDILDTRGDLELRVDPERSLLFPESGSGPAAGRGLFTFSSGVRATLSQVLEPSFGGERNHFGRAIGRRVQLNVTPVGQGRLEGQFTETLYGLTGDPIQLGGEIHLEPVASVEVASFRVPPEPTMPEAADSSLPAADTFPGWTEEACSCACPGIHVLGWASGGRHSSQTLACANLHGLLGYAGLQAVSDRTLSSTQPMSELAPVCEADLTRAPEPHCALKQSECASPALIGCALRTLVQAEPFTTEDLPNARASMVRLFARTLSPGLVVAQDHIAQGLKESFVDGPRAARSHLESARRALTPAVAWGLAPGILNAMRTVPAEIAQGQLTNEDPTSGGYPAAKALIRALYVLSTIDSEEARHSAGAAGDDRPTKSKSIAERSVLSFLEAAVATQLLEAWNDPVGMGGEFAGILNVADAGFTALGQGALSFGVPEGEIPLVVDPEHPMAPNFRNVLALAAPAFAQYRTAQDAFIENTRTAELNADRLQNEIEQVRHATDAELFGLCGANFRLDQGATDAAVSSCGAAGDGEVAALAVEMTSALNAIQAAVERSQAAYKKIEIDEKRMLAHNEIRKADLAFIDEQGRQRQMLVYAEGFVNACQKALEVAAHASFGNGGAPLGMAVGVAYLEGVRTTLTAKREELATAQQYRQAESEQAHANIDATAEIKKQVIDLGGLALDTLQQQFRHAELGIRRANVLERVRRLLTERQRTLARLSESPFGDPTYRTLATREALSAIQARENAQRWLLRVGRALEYETNTPLGTALSAAVLASFNAKRIEETLGCFQAIEASHRVVVPAGQTETTIASVRELLGIFGPRKDEVTGAELSPAELFRLHLLRNENVAPDGTVSLTFSTNLAPGNGLWSSHVCDDKIQTVQAQLVGDFQGDNQAELIVELSGGSLVRRCDSEEIRNWDLRGPQVAVIPAGVNSFGESAANSSLFGQSVARANWRVSLPSGQSSPKNADLDLTRLDDIVLKIQHTARPKPTELGLGNTLDLSCLRTASLGTF